MPVNINNSLALQLNNMNPEPDGVVESPRPFTFTAKGTVQADATLLRGGVILVNSYADTAGVMLPLYIAETLVTLYNKGPNAVKVYPPVGGAFNASTINAPITLAAGASYKFISTDNSGGYNTMAVSVATGGSLARQPATNGNTFPFSNTDSANANYVRNSSHKKFIATNAKYSQVQIAFPWWAANPTGELAGGSLPQITLRASVVFNRTRYQLAFGGSQDIVLNQGDTAICDVIPGLTLDASVSPYIRVNVRVTGPNSGSFLYPRSGICNEANNEGALLGTNTAVDYTDATTIPMEAEGTPVFTGASITGVNISYTGANYTAGGELWASDYDQYGHYFKKQIGTFSVSGGVVTGVTITDGTPPTDGPSVSCTPAVTLPAWTNPTISFSYGTANFNNASRAFASYSSALVSGVPDRAVKSLAIWGNSLPRGNGQVGTVKGDKKSNMGIYEIAIANRCGIINYAIGSGQAQYFANMATNYPLLGAFIQSANGFTTHGLIDSTSNDIALAGRNATQVTADVNTMGTYLRTGGRLVTYATISARATTSITNDYINGVQTPVTGFGTGGVAETVQANIVNLAGITADWNVIRTDQLVNAAGSPMTWRTDITCVTTDGVHEIAAGLGIARVNSAFANSFSVLT